MIAVTLLCAGMGVVSNQASRQRRAAERIKAAHGLVFYDYQLDAEFNPRTDDLVPPGPDWLRNLIGVDYLATAASVKSNVATDELLEAAADLPHLRALSIACDSKITDGGWEHLRRLTELETLCLRGMRDSGMVNLSGLARLRSLYVTQTNVTDAGLASLKDLTQLQTLQLWQTKVSDAGLVHLKGLTKLRELNLRRTKVTDAGMKDFQKALPNCKIEH